MAEAPYWPHFTTEAPDAQERAEHTTTTAAAALNMADGPEVSSMDYLKQLEDELICSICLSPFQCPVTIPCGHNFCQECLAAVWQGSYDCPQCRAHFATKPELKKNTVLSSVADALRTRLGGAPDAEAGPRGKEIAAAAVVVLCDTCMSAEAVNTCLTCVASFCEEHIQPHRGNPNYRLHQLREPLGDLAERICPDHHKLMDFYCEQHNRSICSFCLQQVHKGCSFTDPEERKGLKETEFRSKLVLVDSKIVKTQAAISQIAEAQDKLKDSVTSRKQMLGTQYQQIRDMLDRDEREAMNTVDRQQQSGEAKLNNLIKKFSKNILHMESTKQDIGNLLAQSDKLSFLQASVDLPPIVNVECTIPRVNLDSPDVIGNQTFVVILKDYLDNLFKSPVNTRLTMLQPGDVPKERGPSQKTPKSYSPGPPYQGFRPPLQFQNQGLHHSPGPLQGPGFFPGQVPFQGPVMFQVPRFPGQQPNKQQTQGRRQKLRPAHSTENLLTERKRDQSKGRKHEPKATECPETTTLLPSITSPVNRHELLKYATVLTLDPKTAHRRVKLSDDLTGASVTEEAANYPDSPARFAVCSQVMTSKGFSRGRHYWEVKLSSCNFVGIGLAYNSMERKGPSSRLGRNAQSWCVEWFTLKLSAWHANVETSLESVSPTRIGVLVDCDEGTATFYGIAGKAIPFHTFVFPFTEAVYPAFWIFSNTSQTSFSLCNLSA